MEQTNLSKLQLTKYSERMSICIDCANAVGKCSWSQSFTPVDGWTATPSKYLDNGHKVFTYQIINCPLFKPDRPHHYGYQVSIEMVAKLCGTTARNVSRWSVQKINKKLKSKFPNIEAVWYRDPTEENGSFYLQKCP